MKFLSYKNSEGFEITSGILLLILVASISILGIEQADREIYSGIMTVAFAGVFLSHVLVKQRALRLISTALGIMGFMTAAFLALRVRDITLLLFFLSWGLGLFLADKGVIEGLKEGASTNSKQPALLTVISGAILFLIGTSFAGTAIWPEWFRPHLGHLLFGSGAYLITTFIFAFSGAGLMLGELKNWKGIRRIGTKVLGAGLFGAIGVSYVLDGLLVSAFPFLFVGVMVLLEKYLSRARIVPDNMEKASSENVIVYGYEHIGRITIWLVVIWVGIAGSFHENITPYAFLAFGIAAVVSILYYNFTPIEKYTKKSYLVSLGALTFGYDLFWLASGGIESHFTFLAFIIVIAVAVVAEPIWVVPFSLFLWAVPLIDAFTNLHGHTHKLTEFTFFTISLLIISLYAFLLGKKREDNTKNLEDARLIMEKALAQEESTRKKFVSRAKSLESLNTELVEMRSALLNVLEDVENSKKQLEIDHRRQDAVFTSIGEGVVASDMSGKVILANKRAAQILNLPHQDLLGKGIETIMKFQEGDNEVLDTSIFRDVWSGKEGKLKENHFLLRNDGQRVPIAGNAMPFIDDKEHISGIVLAFRDVTAKREIEQQKSGFIDVASHQLRTPINAVRWYVDLLLAGDVGRLSKQQKEFVGDISTSVVRMATLIDDLLQVSRAEEGKTTINLEPIAAADIASGIVKEIALLAKTRKQVLEVDIKDDLPLVNTDKKAIEQVLENLLSNAVKYTPEGGKITLTATRSEGEVLFEVTDTGYGIPKEYQHHVFEKFYRGKRAVTMETVGTGLGLYIARHLIESCGGSIRFESTEGKGSRFFFTLPVVVS